MLGERSRSSFVNHCLRDAALIWLAAGLVILGGAVFIRGWANRIAVRSLDDPRGRVDRFKLTRKAVVRDILLADHDVAEAVRLHAAETGGSSRDAWRRVESYIDEIVPFFNVLTYYRIGLVVSRAFLNLFYEVSAEYVGDESPRLPPDSIVLYLMNHRSNADYVLVGYVLSGRVAISYAVGEWARIFPLEHIFKSFGAYFVRRKFRERLYHTILEKYVQLITRNAVTQGIFLEGGLSRDGKLGRAKIGLMDYVIGVAKDPDFRNRLHVVPVAINYDRVLEDRSLLRELDVRGGGRRPPLYVQMGEVMRYVWWNLARLVWRRWKRYGRAVVVVGEPISLAPWIDEEDRTTGDFFGLDRADRLARVQLLADSVLEKIGALVPVTPVPLACAALQSFDGDFVPHNQLLGRMSEMQEVLTEVNGRAIHGVGSIEETFDRAWRMLRMRRILAAVGDGYAVLPGGRELISYYANSIAHLLGPFTVGIKARDALPSAQLSAGMARIPMS